MPKVQVESRGYGGPQIWSHLYEKGMVSMKDRQKKQEEAARFRKEKEETEITKLYTFKPQLSEAGKAYSTQSKVVDRLYRSDCKHRRANLAVLEQAADKAQDRICTFRPDLKESSAAERRNESQEEFVERLFQEAEERKGRLEAKREQFKTSERSKIEAEHCRANYHYAQKLQRDTEREKEKRLRQAEMTESTIPQQPQKRSGNDHSQHDVQESSQDHSSTPRPTGSFLSARRPIVVEAVMAETRHSTGRSAPPANSHQPVRRDDDVVSDISRSSLSSSNSTERVPPPRRTIDVPQVQSEAVRADSDEEEDEASDVLRAADRRTERGSFRAERTIQPEPFPSDSLRPQQQSVRIVSEAALWDTDEEEEEDDVV